MEKFFIGQIFEENYPPEAALWCSEHDAFIVEAEKNKFEIKAMLHPDIAILRAQKKREAQTALTQAIEQITPYYPTDEKVSFAKQEEEALKYKANPEISESEIPCIAGIAKGRQIDLAVLAEKILAKAAIFSMYSGIYMGRKQRIEDLADKAQTEEEINAVNVAAIFAEPLE